MERDVTTAIAILQDALDRCRTEDMRTPEVFAALEFLAAAATAKWPFKQFRAVSLSGSNELLTSGERYWENGVLSCVMVGIFYLTLGAWKNERENWLKKLGHCGSSSRDASKLASRQLATPLRTER
jgi:hypothetical protein